MSETPPDKFEAFLLLQLQSHMKQHGRRMTPERKLLAEIMVRLVSPFKVVEIFTAVERAKKSVARSTVYRMIRFFEEAGLLQSKKSANETLYAFHTISRESDSRCEATHPDLIAGTCPRCGRAIIEGEVQDDSD